MKFTEVAGEKQDSTADTVRVGNDLCGIFIRIITELELESESKEIKEIKKQIKQKSRKS